MRTTPLVVVLLTSYPLSTAIWKERSCMGMTERTPCRQSTVWGTSTHLYPCACVSASFRLQTRIGRPYKQVQPIRHHVSRDHTSQMGQDAKLLTCQGWGWIDSAKVKVSKAKGRRCCILTFMVKVYTIQRPYHTCLTMKARYAI